MTIHEEIQTVAEFIRGASVSDSIHEMEADLGLAIGYGQRIGELLNEAEAAYSRKRAESIARLSGEEETETTRKAKLDAWVADDRKLVADLKNLHTHLRELKMMFMQAIKTRREEPR